MKSASIEGWKPELEISIEKEKDTKIRENRQYELDYKSGFDKYMKGKRGYERKCYKVYPKNWENIIKL